MRNTVFILAGGNDRITEGYGKRLDTELNKYISSPQKILSCFFSAPENDWPTKHHDWQAWFKENFSFAFTYEHAQKTTFLKQIDGADIIYLHGGNTRLLFDSLPETDQLKKYFKGKIVVGSSAGANALSNNYWSSSRAVPAHGLGIVDLNIMVHYGTLSHEGRARTTDDWKKEEAEFQKFIGDGKITHIPEGQFIVKKLDI